MIDTLIIVACFVSIASNVLVLRAKGLMPTFGLHRRKEPKDRPPSLTKLA
jgi:hypothetical protein